MDSPNRPAASDRYDLASFKSLLCCNIYHFSEEEAVPYCCGAFALLSLMPCCLVLLLLCPLYTLLLCASGESGGSISRDEYISQVAQDIQNKLPKLFDMDVIRKKFGTDISPTSVVLLQELERFNKLVVRMQRSLAELQRVSRRERGQQNVGKQNSRVCVSRAGFDLFRFSCVPLGLGW